MSNYYDKRVSLTLSNYAEHVISSDMHIFDLKFNTLVNLIVSHYKASSEASIRIAIKKRENELLETLKGDSTCKQVEFQPVIKSLIKKYEADLVSRMQQYKKDSGITRKILITRDNLDLIDQNQSEYYTHPKHYLNLSDYIKALLEEYARLSIIEREQIIFSDIYQDVSLHKGYNAKITTKNNKRFKVRLYDVRPDERDNYNYVITYTAKDSKASSFRLSRIKSINLEGQGDITSQEKLEIEGQIKKMGIPYLNGTPQTIRIQFTEKGLNMYNTILHLRPRCEKEDGKILEFYCSPRQIRDYFFKFGKDARVIEPVSIAEEFKRDYIEASKTYDLHSV